MNFLSENKYISIDANEIGKKLERYILNGNLSGLELFSNSLSVNVGIIKQRILDLGGHVYMAGGDNILAEIQYGKISEVVNLIDEMNQEESYRFSIGVGDTPANAYIAIKYAKVNELFAIKFANDGFSNLI